MGHYCKGIHTEWREQDMLWEFWEMLSPCLARDTLMQFNEEAKLHSNLLQQQGIVRQLLIEDQLSN